jgi:hypothetical protein
MAEVHGLRGTALLLLLTIATADRFLIQTVLDCKVIHPSCNSCAVVRKNTTTNSLVANSSLVCKGCTAPQYKLSSDANSSTCGELILNDLATARGSCMGLWAQWGCLKGIQPVHSSGSSWLINNAITSSNPWQVNTPS